MHRLWPAMQARTLALRLAVDDLAEGLIDEGHFHIAIARAEQAYRKERNAQRRQRNKEGIQ